MIREGVSKARLGLSYTLCLRRDDLPFSQLPAGCALSDRFASLDGSRITVELHRRSRAFHAVRTLRRSGLFAAEGATFDVRGLRSVEKKNFYQTLVKNNRRVSVFQIPLSECANGCSVYVSARDKVVPLVFP